MAWNGSDQTTNGAPRRRGLQAASPRAPQSNNPKSQIKRSSPLLTSRFSLLTSHFSLLTLLLLLALAGAAVWYFFLRPAPPPPPEKLLTSHSSLITSHTPAPARTNAVPKRHNAKWEPEKQAVKTADVKPPSLEAFDVIDYGRITSDQFFGRKLFKSWTDNYLAGLLQMTPGDLIIDPTVSDKFEEQFKRSLDDKIEILPEDTEDDVAVKKAVIEAKAHLKECMDRGESVKTILEEANDDMMKICEYRNKLEKNVSLLLKNDGSKQDVLDYFNEANEMLKQYSARPLTIKPFALRKLEQRELERQSSQIPVQETKGIEE